MCGIAVVLGPDVERRPELLDRMLAPLSPRGEVTETHAAAGVLAGTRRLRIVDRDNAVQPLVADGRLIVFNGEIFNFRELQQRLGDRHAFRTDSDTETVLAAYAAHGEHCVEHLDGQFSFAIVDLESGGLFCARDPIGITPLYYAQAEGRLHVASEIKALTWLGVPILDVPPGHVMTERLAPVPYYAPQPREEQWQLDDFLGALRERLAEAVRKRVQTDLPLGVIYSGGLDSSLVLHHAVQMHRDVTAFTVGSDDSEDFRVSQRFCKELGIRQVTIPLGRSHFDTQVVREAIRVSELTEYGDIVNAVVTLQLFRRVAAEGVRVTLCGDGSDELFGGYDMYALDMSEDDHRRLFVHKLANLHRTELQRVDRCSMASAVETRVPFLDGGLLDLAMRMPRAWKNRDGVEKWCLREAHRQDLPDYVIGRKKNPMSHSSGLHEWIRRYKPMFAGSYREQRYDLHGPLRKDFSYLLLESGFDVDRAIQAARRPRDYSRAHLLLESAKATARTMLGRT